MLDLAMSENPALSIVIPAHNEAANIANLLAEIHGVLDGGIPYEVIVVDDASSDGMDKILVDRARQDARLRPLRHRYQAGQSAALRSGIMAARGGLIATLDGDGQNDPADIPNLLSLYRSEAGRGEAIICGHRITRRDTGLRRFSSRFANAIRARLLRDATPDTGCGLKLFARDLYCTMPYFDHMHRYFPALAIREGARVISCPVNHRPRNAGRSHYGVWNRLWVGIADIAGVWWLMRRRRKAGDILPLYASQSSSGHTDQRNHA